MGEVNESDAQKKYEAKRGRKVEKCGLFVSHELLFVAAKTLVLMLWQCIFFRSLDFLHG